MGEGGGLSESFFKLMLPRFHPPSPSRPSSRSPPRSPKSRIFLRGLGTLTSFGGRTLKDDFDDSKTSFPPPQDKQPVLLPNLRKFVYDGPASGKRTVGHLLDVLEARLDFGSRVGGAGMARLEECMVVFRSGRNGGEEGDGTRSPNMGTLGMTKVERTRWQVLKANGVRGEIQAC